MGDRMELMKQIKGQVSTHNCPNCGGGAYCAMEAGKSANLCWCMGIEKDTNVLSDVDANSCLCRGCLTKTEN